MKARVLVDAPAVRAYPWPPVFRVDDVDLVVRGSRRAARGPRERRLFAAILRRAHDDVAELELLAAELPGVLAGDHLARRRFQGILEDVWLPAGGPGSRSLGDLGFTTPGDIPCAPGFMVGPDVMLALMLGADRVAQGDPMRRERYMDALDALWTRTRLLDRFFHAAREDVAAGGHPRLGDTLRLVVRGLERGGHLPVDPGAGFPGPDDGGLPPGSFPDPDGPQPWPGPDDGPPIPGLPAGPGIPGGPTGWPPHLIPDPCDLIRDHCRQAARAAARGLGGPPPPASTWADTITSIAPKAACVGQTVTLSGSFPATQPSGVVVLIGFLVAPVVSWSATQIVVTVPPGAKSGCVGFRNEQTEATRQQDFAALQGALAQLEECFGPIGTHGEAVPYVPSTPPCTPVNFFEGTVPEIENFLVNGAVLSESEPGESLTFTAFVRNASTVQFTLASATATLDTFNTAGGAFAHTATPKPTVPFVGTARLRAQNACGFADAELPVAIRKRPHLSILRVEVVQTVQKPDNTVRLVSRKRTMARVFVTSGLTGGFDYGAGANALPGLTGELRIWTSGSPVAQLLTPLNAGGTIVAQENPSRSDLTQTLNFELPAAQLDGPVSLEARAWAPDAIAGGGKLWNASPRTAAVTFQPRRQEHIFPVLLMHASAEAGRPTAADFFAALEETRRRFPVGEDGFVVELHGPAMREIVTSNALVSGADLEDQILDLMDLADDMDLDAATILAGVYTPNPSSTKGKGGIMIEYTLIPPHVQYFRCAIAQAGVIPALAHEFGHTLDLGHAPCGPACMNADPRMPSNGLTEEVGMDVPAATVMSVGRGDIMSCCNTPVAWTSLKTWDVAFDALA